MRRSSRSSLRSSALPRRTCVPTLAPDPWLRVRLQKITAANSFKTNLLENLDTAVGMDFKETNFQQASCALDAGAKIYASRVDNVHSNTLKVLGGLGRTDQGHDDGDESMSL